MGGSSILAPSLAIGDTYCASGQQLVVDTYTSSTDQLYVVGNASVTGQLTAAALVTNGAVHVGNGLTSANWGCNVTSHDNHKRCKVYFVAEPQRVDNMSSSSVPGIVWNQLYGCDWRAQWLV